MRVFLALLVTAILALPAQAAVLGDVNYDGQVDLTEAVYALRAAANLPLPQAPTPEEQAELEDVVNSVAMAMGDSYSAVSGMDEVNEVLEYLGLDNVSGETALAVAQSLKDQLVALDECVDFEGTVQSKTFTITFLSNANCYTVTGSLTLTVNSVSVEGISYSVQYNNIQYDGCTINGSSTVTVKVAGSQVTITQTPTNLSVCGNTLSGTISITYDVITGAVVSASVDATYSYTLDGEPVTVAADLTYTPDGGYSGTLDVTMGGETYTCVAAGLVIDPDCGVPIAGTLEINGITLDFSGTTCENPNVTVLVHGFPVTLSLEEAAALFMGI
ncbi:MAG: hypothetical protein KKA60_03955 [Proteobacteria bacterium]|nr:hypothetical protein [Pseudomonadota bacterium]